MPSVKVIWFTHQEPSSGGGGTKDYDICLLSSDTCSLVIRRWGKTGAFGQVKVSKFSTQGTAMQDLNRERQRREKSGYELLDSTEDFAETRQELVDLVGPVWTRIDPNIVEMLWPGWDSDAGLKLPAGATATPRTKQCADPEEVQKEIDRKANEAAAKALRKQEDLKKMNDTWGMF